MKKVFIILMLLFFVTTVYARVPKRPLVQIGPRASLYISSIRLGMGAEVVFNPLRFIGVRFDMVEVSFGEGGTFFSLNEGLLYQGCGGSLDVLYYLPIRGLQPYVHSGFGLFTDGDEANSFFIRGGMGLDFVMNKQTTFFAESGIMIIDPGAGDTDFIFRLGGGAKFGILK